MNEFLQEIVNQWTILELTGYISQLEARMKETHALLKELKAIRKKKLGKKHYENGPRGGL